MTATELRAYTNIPAQNAALNPLLESSVLAASRGVNLFCHRQFNRADVATPRVYTPLSRDYVCTDDFWTTEDLVIALDNGSGLYTTILSPSDYVLKPVNGVVNGEPGWPFWRIKLRGYATFGRGSSVQVTAKWGWESVPENVKEATKLLANEGFASKDAPLGVVGTSQFGEVRVRPNSLVAKRLYGMVRDPINVGGGGWS